MQVRRLLALLAVLSLVLGSAEADARRKKKPKRNAKAVVGAVVIKCPMRGAVVMLDDNEVGKTPMKQLTVPVGEHTIKVKKPGFLYFTRKVKVEKGKTIRLKADLLPFAGVINVTSKPKKARVLVDNEEVGITPLEYEVKLGKRVVQVKADGYKTFEKTVKSTPGKTTRIKARLRKGKDPEPEPPAVAAVTPEEGDAAAADGAGAEPAAGDDLDLAMPGAEPLTELAAADSASGEAGGMDDLDLAMPGLEDPSLATPTDAGGGGDELSLEPPPEGVPEGDLMALEGLPGGGLELTPPGSADPLSLTALPGMAPPVAEAPKGPPPIYKRWYFITGVAGGAIALATAIIVPIAVVASQPQEAAVTEVEPEVIWSPGQDPIYPQGLIHFFR